MAPPTPGLLGLVNDRVAVVEGRIDTMQADLAPALADLDEQCHHLNRRLLKLEERSRIGLEVSPPAPEPLSPRASASQASDPSREPAALSVGAAVVVRLDLGRLLLVGEVTELRADGVIVVDCESVTGLVVAADRWVRCPRSWLGRGGGQGAPGLDVNAGVGVSGACSPRGER